MIRICPLKRRRRKEVKENPNWVANGKFQNLVAFGRFHYLVAFERFQCLVANGRKRRNTFSILLTFPPQILLKPSFFPLILRFYFTMVKGHYLCISFLFLDL
jgi:hypothetical protein